MAEREKTQFALGVAAGAAVMAAGAGAAAALVGGRDKSKPPSMPDADNLEEDISGRGDPSGKPDAESVESGYDIKDANVSALVRTIALALTVMVASLAAVFYMFSRFDHAYQASNKDLTAQQLAPIEPPLPHLQAVPYREIDATLLQQTRKLTTYGWTSSDHKAAHIPIERAIQQVIGKPLDGQAQTDAAGPEGSSEPQQATPALNADIQQNKPANRVQGEGNPNTIAPSYTPTQFGHEAMRPTSMRHAR